MRRGARLLQAGALFAALVLCSRPAGAVERFLAPDGSDSGSCTGEKHPCRTLQYAMARMQGGDTLFLEDGEYAEERDTIWQFNYPPSGRPGAFTVIRARHIPGVDGVPVDQPLKVRFSGKARFAPANYPDNDRAKKVQYVKFWGIRWEGFGTYANWDHIIFKQCASMGVQDGNAAPVGISGTNTLLEDVVTFGKGRYGIVFYDTTQSGVSGNNLCRRCVVRLDWANRNEPSSMPIGGITSYYLRDNALVNSMVIDSDTPAQWHGAPTEIGGAFYQPNDGGPHRLTVKGCLALNDAMAVLATKSGSSGHLVRDLVGVRVAGGIVANGALDAERVTLVSVGSAKFDYRTPQQRRLVQGADTGVLNWSGSPVALRDSILRSVAGDAFHGASISADHVDLFDIGGRASSKANLTGTLTVDPLAHGLRFPVGVEPGSRLARAGVGGGALGARLIHRLGVDGTFKGEPGWDAEQSLPLWPWPLEGWIQAEMRSSTSAHDPRRGFCAQGQTLTRYVWQMLGTPLPAGLYGAGETPAGPPAPPAVSLKVTPSDVVEAAGEEGARCAALSSGPVAVFLQRHEALALLLHKFKMAALLGARHPWILAAAAGAFLVGVAAVRRRRPRQIKNRRADLGSPIGPGKG